MQNLKTKKSKMKKLISILCLLASLNVSSQSVSTMVKSATTFTNSTAVTATLQVNAASENISIQAIATKSTGTVAGTVALSVSLDGTNYISLTSNTLALTDVTTNTAIFPLTNSNYLFYKLTFTGTGTMVATPAGYVYSSGTTNKHVVSNMLSPYSAVKDTTDDTGTSYITLGVQKWYNTVTIQSVVTKISGTVAGTVTLQGSIDGTNYVTVNSSYADVTSYSPTDVATSTKLFVVTGSPYRYYRLSYTGAGTMSASHRGYVLPNLK